MTKVKYGWTNLHIRACILLWCSRTGQCIFVELGEECGPLGMVHRRTKAEKRNLIILPKLTLSQNKLNFHFCPTKFKHSVWVCSWTSHLRFIMILHNINNSIRKSCCWIILVFISHHPRSRRIRKMPVKPNNETKSDFMCEVVRRTVI